MPHADAKYDYLILFKDEQGKEQVKGPVSITLACTERDKELLAQREKMVKEYYQKKGMELKEYGAGKPSVPSGQAAVRTDLAVAGRCGVVTLTWAEAKMIDKESIEVKRKAQDEDYLMLKDKKIYQREEATGEIRYWVGDALRMAIAISTSSLLKTSMA